MPESLVSFDILPALREGEALFARGDDDELIRQERKTQADFDQKINLTIDDEKVTVPRATAVTDAQGNVKLGPDGRPIPRTTTIYDAAATLVKDGRWTQAELSERIPVLCHQDHITPVAVCRMCAVHVSKFRKRDKGKPNARPVPAEKLVPACQHEVQEDMIVTTRLGGVMGLDSEGFAGQVGRATRLLTEMLLADHHHPDPARDDRFRNELVDVAKAVRVKEPRAGFTRNEGRNLKLHRKSRPISLPVLQPSEKPLPYSSRSISVDHDRCILCDRCVRACSEVKPFKVIGHTGKGYRTRISFDLDQVMNDSSCVQCGECMTSCPTGALTLNRRVNPLGSWPDAAELNRWVQKNVNYTPTGDDRRHPFPHLTYFNDPKTEMPPGFPSAKELIGITLKYKDIRGHTREYRPFEAIPLPYLRWNEGGVCRRAVEPGDILCRKDEFGSTAFLLESGEYEILVPSGATGVSTWFRKASDARTLGNPVAVLIGGVDLIAGEMACLTNTRRTATIRAKSAGVVYEVTRNMLTMLQRSRSGREVLEQCYVPRAVRDCLNNGKLFRGLTAEQRQTVLNDVVRDAELITVEPGKAIVSQGNPIGLDETGRHRGDLYVIRIGSVEVFREEAGATRVLAKLTRNEYFGEIALLSADLKESGALPADYPVNRRTATVRALDDVEVVRIKGDAFRRLFEKLPTLTVPLLEQAAASLAVQRQAPPLLLGTYLSEGLFQGQQMLVLDLESCTRCDECTKACADAHGDGHSRLLREGPRFGKFLVATSCRSCHTPYCMDGCPVDAIHRGAMSLEVRIDSHCIGCSLCANNCPYESIQMTARDPDAADGRRVAAVAQQAVNCDLCNGLVPVGAEPFCVSACPHEAAFRWTGEKLYAEVAKGS